MLLVILEVHPRIMRILRHADVSMTLEAPANASSTVAGEALRRQGSGQRNGHDVKLRRAARQTVWHEHLAAGRPAGVRCECLAAPDCYRSQGLSHGVVQQLGSHPDRHHREDRTFDPGPVPHVGALLEVTTRPSTGPGRGQLGVGRRHLHGRVRVDSVSGVRHTIYRGHRNDQTRRTTRPGD